MSNYILSVSPQNQSRVHSNYPRKVRDCTCCAFHRELDNVSQPQWDFNYQTIPVAAMIEMNVTRRKWNIWKGNAKSNCLLTPEQINELSWPGCHFRANEAVWRHDGEMLQVIIKVLHHHSNVVQLSSCSCLHSQGINTNPKFLSVSTGWIKS